MCPGSDAIRDALALITAVHKRDGEAKRVLLDHGDTRLMALAAAMVAEALISDLAQVVSQDQQGVMDAAAAYLHSTWDGGDG